MTDAEYNAKYGELLTGVHPKLAGVLSSQAWQRGHSHGMSEVMNILEGLVYDFREVNEILVKAHESKS